MNFNYHDKYALSNLITQSILQQGEQEIDLTIRSLKELLVKAITSTPNEKLIELIRTVFPHDNIYMPISELVGKNQHTIVRNLEDVGIYLAGQLTYISLNELSQVKSFTKEGPRTKLLIEALEKNGLHLKAE